MNDTWWVKLGQLDDDQKRIIPLALNEDHLVVGPPGSGKTNLLLLRANYVVRAGQPNILLLVFTRTLQEFLATGAAQYAFAPSRIKTTRKWALQFLRQHGRVDFDLDSLDF